MGAIQPDDGDVAAVRTIARESSREPTQEDCGAIILLEIMRGRKPSLRAEMMCQQSRKDIFIYAKVASALKDLQTLMSISSTHL
eukprot:scaffold36193_cov216-Skeletonema_dohrnii-CCMP3373.AAC.2